jgi:hypothetical protein
MIILHIVSFTDILTDWPVNVLVFALYIYGSLTNMQTANYEVSANEIRNRSSCVEV